MTRKQSNALRKVRQSAPWAAACIEQRNADIRAAVAAGVSLRDVGDAAGLGHTTVARIAKAVGQ